MTVGSLLIVTPISKLPGPTNQLMPVSSEGVAFFVISSFTMMDSHARFPPIWD
jgi:hypothetical protein